MTNVFIQNNTKEKFGHKKLFFQIADEIVLIEKIKRPTEFSLIIVGDAKIKSLARQFKNKDYITDVLSFSNDWKALAKLTNVNTLGDIYINKNKVISQAKKYQHTIKREYSYLFAHGLLHLLGYDHIDKKTEKIMHNKIESVLRKLGVKR